MHNGGERLNEYAVLEGSRRGVAIVFFSVIGRSHMHMITQSKAYLIEDNWDDWNKFRTKFQLVVYDRDGNKFDAGSLKIGQFGLMSGPIGTESIVGIRAPTLDREFDALGDGYFSLGQSETYYETLNGLPNDLRVAVLKGLKDCALNLKLFKKAQKEQVMQESLLRGISKENVQNRFHRLANGDARLTDFYFKYTLPHSRNDPPPPVLTFDVQPYSTPPTNVHVVVGRNGSGKTRCLRHMAKALLDGKESSGKFRQSGINKKEWTVAGLIFVSFSAFDDFDPPEAESSEICLTMVGLRQSGTTQDDQDQTNTLSKHRNKDAAESLANRLARDFCSSFEKCRTGLRRKRWRAAIRTLENDPLFAEAEITTLLDSSERRWREDAENLFRQLSSGHAIVLLTTTRLVELVDERTLVLFDEPESHLHPPLLSAFIRALADLLIKRNGVAIIATHSPVVLQEVPRSCVWVLRRSGNVSAVERPMIETFGENVGTLTREVFGLEVTTTGFHHMVRHAIENEMLDYDDVLDHFEGQLGSEARAIGRGLIANRNAEQ